MGEYPVAAFGAHRAASTNFRDKSQFEIDPRRFHYALSAANADWAMSSLLAPCATITSAMNGYAAC